MLGQSGKASPWRPRDSSIGLQTTYVCVDSQSGDKLSDDVDTAGPILRSGGPGGFSVKGSANPASTSLLLLLAGDIETNPGPQRRSLSVPARNVLTLSYLNKRLTSKSRPTPNLLMGDSTIQAVDNENWNVRSVSGGTPEHLLEWVRHKPEILNGISNITILVGGNSVCSKWNKDKPTSTPTLTTQAIFELVRVLKERGIQSVQVLGIPKRSCKADPNKTRSQKNGSSNPPPKRDACKPGENDSIRLVNDALRQNAEVHGYKFVGVGDLCSRSFYSLDGVHLNSTGIARLAKILRRSCL